MIKIKSSGDLLTEERADKGEWMKTKSIAASTRLKQSTIASTFREDCVIVKMLRLVISRVNARFVNHFSSSVSCFLHEMPRSKFSPRLINSRATIWAAFFAFRENIFAGDPQKSEPFCVERDSKVQFGADEEREQQKAKPTSRRRSTQSNCFTENVFSVTSVDSFTFIRFNDFSDEYFYTHRAGTTAK